MTEPTDSQRIDYLKSQVSKLTRERSDAWEAIGGWKKLLEISTQRLVEAEKLLWPSRITNPKVRDHFARWHDINGNVAASQPQGPSNEISQ